MVSLGSIFISLFKVYHQVNLILPFREILSIEKATESVNVSEIETQSAVIITSKERVKLISLQRGDSDGLI